MSESQAPSHPSQAPSPHPTSTSLHHPSTPHPKRNPAANPAATASASTSQRADLCPCRKSNRQSQSPHTPPSTSCKVTTAAQLLRSSLPASALPPSTRITPTISPHPHHRQSAPVSPAAQTAPPQAPHPRYQTTAHPALWDALASATVSPARATVSSWTVVEADVVIVMIRARAVHPTRKKVPLRRQDAKASLFADESIHHLNEKGKWRKVKKKEKHAESLVHYGFLLYLHLLLSRVGTGFFRVMGTHTKPNGCMWFKFSCTPL